MKTKLDLAHDYAMKHIGVKNLDYSKLADCAWEYADLMYEQLDKRTVRGVPLELEERMAQETADLWKKQELEWQPDWSQAPDGFDWFAIDGVGPFWYRNMPTWDGKEWSDYEDCKPGSETEPAMLFGYQGSHMNSLRKRP